MAIEPRLATHIRVAAVRRRVEQAGGFATILHRGDDIAGALVILTTENGANMRFWQQFPALDGSQRWEEYCAPHNKQAIEYTQFFNDKWRKMCQNDPDLWVIELDIAQAERFIAD